MKKVVYPVDLSVMDETFDMGYDASEPIDFELDSAIQPISGEKYEGSYEVTPSAETQTLLTADLFMSGNVIINPIPSNYGLVTWNGSTLTVS